MTATTARRPSLLWPSLAALVALAILLGLGAWQLQRQAWKDGLIAQIEARAYGEPVPPPAASAFSAADEYRRVRATGTFRHDREVQVHGLMAAARGQPVQGFYVLTPLVLDDGSTIIVNRGFVPTELRRPEARPEGQAPGRATVTGLLRAPEAKGWFVPENDPAREAWFTRDPGAIAAARSLERVAPYLIDAEAAPGADGWPRGGQTRLDLPNNHRHYAATWFGIAGTLVGVYAAFAWRRLRAP